MKVLLVILALSASHYGQAEEFTEMGRLDIDPVFRNLQGIFESSKSRVDKLKGIIRDLGQQVMLQQLYVEERVRSEGDSGLKLTRGGRHGLKNYESNTHISHALASMHDHSNYDRTVGLGEFVVVINGVDFRTRHNDYKLVMPSTTSTDYHATEPIPFPGVPPEVSKLNSVQEQVDEMQEWFHAFSKQDPSIRDYRKYFKPVLCYMEGAWTHSATMDEPFDSDRHHIDAKSWVDLQEKIRFSSYCGTKDRRENYAYLPTTIIGVNSTTGVPEYAQWNYRILCHPIKKDVPLKYFHQVDDMSYRMAYGRDKEDMKYSRAARFKLYEGDRGRYELMDEIFYDIPGWDNIPAKSLKLSTYEEGVYEIKSTKMTPLRTGYYHRWFKFTKPGAIGMTTVARGFNDENLWVAQTTQKQVAAVGLERCEKIINVGKVCKKYYDKFTFAIPLEVIFLTPLLSWNPYNLTIHEDLDIASAGKRTGAHFAKKAFDGVDRQLYYLTPGELFLAKHEKDKADALRNSLSVLDQKGVMRQVSASGTKILINNIGDTGKVRLRYPIVPIHGEGSSVWKELNALKDYVEQTSQPLSEPKTVMFQMSNTVRTPPGEHFHDFDMSYKQFKDLINGSKVDVTTSENQGHTHDLTIEFIPKSNSFVYTWCGYALRCADGHPREVFLLTKNQYTS